MGARRHTAQLLFLLLLSALYLATSSVTACWEDSDIRTVPERGVFNVTNLDVTLHAPACPCPDDASANPVLAWTHDGSDPATASSVSVFLAPSPAHVALDNTTVLRVHARCNATQVSRVSSHTFVLVPTLLSQSGPPADPQGQFWSWDMHVPDAVPPPDGQQVWHAVAALPSVSVALPPTDLWLPPFGMMYFDQLLEPHEKPGSVEVLYPPESPASSSRYPSDHFSSAGFPVGVKMQGGGGRLDHGANDHKQSFSLKFKKDHGLSKLRFPIFASAPEATSRAEVGRYDRVILRAGFNMNWSRGRAETVFFRDQFIRDTALAMRSGVPGGTAARGTFVHLFLNGFYWGIYNAVERPDDNFAAHWTGGDDEDYWMTKKTEPADKPSLSWAALERTSVGRKANGARHATWSDLLATIDIASLFHLRILQWWSGVADVQWYATSRDAPVPEPVRFYAWDFEMSFWYRRDQMHSPCCSAWGSARRYDYYAPKDEPTLLTRRILQVYPEARFLLADMVFRHTRPGGALSDAVAIARWDRLAAHLQPALLLESARWGDEWPGKAFTPAHWHKAVQEVRSVSLPGNAAALWGNLTHVTINRWGGAVPPVYDPLFLPLLPPRFLSVADRAVIRAGPGPITVVITASDASAETWYSISSIDHEDKEDAVVAPDVINMTDDMTMASGARTEISLSPGSILTARHRVSPDNAACLPPSSFYNPDLRAGSRPCTDRWTAARRLRVLPPLPRRPVRVTEVQPRHAGGWIELSYNSSLDLAGVRLTRPLQATLPRTPVGLSGNGSITHVVVCRKPAKFAAAFPSAPPCVGASSGTLEFAEDASIVVSVVVTAGASDGTDYEYDDAVLGRVRSWPSLVTGTSSHSLVRVDDSSVWRASCGPGGTPGAASIPASTCPQCWPQHNATLEEAADWTLEATTMMLVQSYQRRTPFAAECRYRDL